MKKNSIKRLLIGLCLTLLLHTNGMQVALQQALVQLDKIIAVTTAIASTLYSNYYLHESVCPLDIRCIQAMLQSEAKECAQSNKIEISFNNQDAVAWFNQHEKTVQVSCDQSAILAQSQTKEATSNGTVMAVNQHKQQSLANFKPSILRPLHELGPKRSRDSYDLKRSHEKQLELSAAEQVGTYVDAQQCVAHATPGARLDSHEYVLQEGQKNAIAADQATHCGTGHARSDFDRNIMALSRIRNSAALAAEFDAQYNNFQHDISSCIDLKDKAAIFQALQKLADPARYTLLKQVPYLEQRFDNAVGALHYLCLNTDGSLRAGGIVGHEIEVARIIAEFNTPLNGEHQFASIVTQMVDLNILGSRGLAQEIKEYYEQPYIGQFLDSFQTKEKHPNLTQQFLAHPVNQRMQQLIDACKHKKWDEAKQQVDAYQALATQKKHDANIQNQYVVSRDILYALGYENGVFKKYAQHPWYQQYTHRDYPHRIADAQINSLFEQHAIIKEAILEKLGVTQPSPLVERVAYELAPVFYNPLAVNQCLSGLCQDHADPKVREAYHVFFDESGIYRLLSHDAKKLEGISIPTSIGDACNVQARALLNTLLKISTPHEKAAQDVCLALKYIESACAYPALKSSYCILSQSLCNALILPNAETIVTSLGDFTLLNQDEHQLKLQQGLVATAAQLCNALNDKALSATQRQETREALIALGAARRAALAYKNSARYTVDQFIKFYRDVVRPRITKVAKYTPAVLAGAIIVEEATKDIYEYDRLHNEGNQQTTPQVKKIIATEQERAGGAPDPNDPSDPEKNKHNELKSVQISEQDASHMFGDRPGHMADTPTNRELLIGLASNASNFLGCDKYGSEWYAKILENGRQLWVVVRDGLIRNGGINDLPKIFNSETGLCRQLLKKK